MAGAGAYDVIVVGSGAGGGTIAHRLTHEGMRVLLIEEGRWLQPGAHSRYIRHVHPDRTQPIACVGGQTKFYGAALYRLREADFEAVAHEAGVSPAWPILYDDLEPYYDQAERLYRVHGATEADPTEPPHARAYPHGAIAAHPRIGGLVEQLVATGLHPAPIPRALDRRDGLGACRMCPACDAHQCGFDAKMDAETAAIRPAMGTGRLTVAEGTRCVAVLTEAGGRGVRGVRVACDGVEEEIAAGVVVVAGGVPRSAMLLRRSRTAKHPEGLGNAGGALGRYLAGHSAGVVFPLVRWPELAEIHTKSFSINDYYHGSAEWPFPLGIIQTAGQMPFWTELPRSLRPVAKAIGRHSLICFCMSEALPTRTSGLHFEGDAVSHTVEPTVSAVSFRRLTRLATEAFRNAGYPCIAPPRAPQLWHQVGTARMGLDAGDSVVDADLQVHGIRGLYVADASVLPSAGAVNTSLTIMALALRCGDHIAGRRYAAFDRRVPAHRCAGGVPELVGARGEMPPSTRR